MVNVNDYMIFDIADTKRLDNIDIVYDYVGIDADALYKKMYLNDAIVIVSYYCFLLTNCFYTD